MIETITIVGILSIIIAYFVGKRNGLNDANRAGISKGTWIVIKDRIKLKERHNIITLLPGTQAIVTGIDKWGRMSIWIAKPWTYLYKDIPKFFDIKEFAKVRIRNSTDIDKQTIQDTLEDLRKWEENVETARSAFFPPGWFEAQQLLNK